MELESEFLNNLSKYCELGYIRKSQHPELPITIYNYTQKASFEEKWDKSSTLEKTEFPPFLTGFTSIKRTIF